MSDAGGPSRAGGHAPPAITCRPRAALSPDEYAAIVALCTRAYAEPFAGYLAPFHDAVHLLAHDGDGLVSHACWIPRRLHRANGGPLHVAYVEAVATEPAHQRRGHATRVLRALAAAIADPALGFACGVLSPSDPAFYAPLGWEAWRGPLATRHPDGRVTPDPDEGIMILRLPHGDATLDLDEGLAAEWRDGEVW